MTSKNKNQNVNISMKDVAKDANVSIATVSRVINNSGYVSESNRMRVEESIRKLGYSHNALARSLVTKESNLIALIIDNISNPFYPQLTLGVEEMAEKNDLNVILCNIESSIEKETNYVKKLIGLQVDGMIFVASKVPENVYGNSININAPVVCLDRQIHIPNCDRVLLDQDWGAYNITKHLINKGHKRIAHIAGPADYLTAKARKNAYKRALTDNNLRPIKRLICEGDYMVDGGRLATEKLLALKTLPTAIFAANDLMAIGAMDTIKRQGLQIPDDIAVAGFDDIPFAVLYPPSLTTVSQPTLQMGTLAMQMVIDRIQGDASLEPREVIFKPTIAVREST